MDIFVQIISYWQSQSQIDLIFFQIKKVLDDLNGLNIAGH